MPSLHRLGAPILLRAHNALLAHPAASAILHARSLATHAGIVECALGLATLPDLRCGIVSSHGAQRTASLPTATAPRAVPNPRALHLVVPVEPLDGAGARAVAMALRTAGTVRRATDWAVSPGPYAFGCGTPVPGGEVIVVSDVTDALICRFASDRAVITFGGPDLSACAPGIAAWLARCDATTIRAILPEAGGRPDLRDMLLEAATRRTPRLVIDSLPAGVRLRDVARLHGTSAVQHLVRTGTLPPALRRAPPGPTTSGSRRMASPPLPGAIGAQFEAYLTALAAREVPAPALARARRDLSHIARCCADLPVATAADLTPEQVARIRVTLELTRHWSRNHSAFATALLRRALRWMTRRGIPVHPDLADLVVPKRLAAPPPPVLSAADVERALDALPVSRPAAVRDRAMLEVLYGTAMRRAELVGLDLADIDYVRRTIRIRSGKGGTSRLVPVHPRALQWLAHYVDVVRVRHLRHAAETALFLSARGRRVRCPMVTTRMSACLRAVGLHGRGSVHIFRHTVATLMHDAGADIRDLQSLLGHALLTSTQLYTRVSLARLRSVHAATHPAADAPFIIEPPPDA